MVTWAFIARCLFFACLAYISSWQLVPDAAEEPDTSSLLQKTLTLNSGESRPQKQLGLSTRQTPWDHAWLKPAVKRMRRSIGKLAEPAGASADSRPQVIKVTEVRGHAVIHRTEIVNSTGNATAAIVLRHLPFVKVSVNVTVETVNGSTAIGQLTNLVERRTIVTEEVAEIASVTEIVITLLLTFVPVTIAWSVYISLGRPYWLYLIVAAVTQGCFDEANHLVTQSLVAVTDAPIGSEAAKAIQMMVYAGLWAAICDGDLIRQEGGVRQYAAWTWIAVLYTIYQTTDHYTSFMCTLSERTIFTNLIVVATYFFEWITMPDEMKPEATSITSRISLGALVLGAILYCESLEFTGGGTAMASAMVCAKVVYKISERSYLNGRFWSLAFCAFINGLVCSVVATLGTLAFEETFLTDLYLLLQNPSFITLLVLSALSLLGQNVSGMLLLRVASATVAGIVTTLAGLLVVVFGVVFFGDQVFSDAERATGLVISLSAALWYSAETYLAKVSANTPEMLSP